MSGLLFIPILIDFFPHHVTEAAAASEIPGRGGCVVAPQSLSCDSLSEELLVTVASYVQKKLL